MVRFRIWLVFQLALGLGFGVRFGVMVRDSVLLGLG